MTRTRSNPCRTTKETEISCFEVWSQTFLVWDVAPCVFLLSLPFLGCKHLSTFLLLKYMCHVRILFTLDMECVHLGHISYFLSKESTVQLGA
jgi:hypothetical protein